MQVKDIQDNQQQAIIPLDSYSDISHRLLQCKRTRLMQNILTNELALSLQDHDRGR